MKSKKATAAKPKALPNTSSMEMTEIEKLIKFVQNSGVSEVSLERKEFKITIKTSHGGMMVPMQIQSAPITHHAASQVAPPVAAPPAVEKVAGSDDSKYITVKSPMIGTFYRSSTPEKPVFVNVGDEVKPGKVICIIEAMKLFNEIECEISGKIIKVLVDNATPVEYDQPLFLVDPS